MDKIPAQLIAKAKKYKVRECDEEIPGKFVAYVDLGDESFDVMIELDENGILKSKSCECNSKGLLCVHVAALILYQHKGKVVKKKAIRQKKRLPHDELLATIDHQQLQLWLSQMLATNKELQFHFMHEFGTKETVLTEEIIAGKMSDSIKAVLGKSKKMDASQVKKVLELWKPQHQKLITAFKEHPDDENTVKLMRAIFSEVSQTVHNYHIAGHA